MRIAHIALDLGSRHERGDGVNDDDVYRAAADEHFRYFERLLAVIGLRNEQIIGVDAQRLRVNGIERVLRVDERRFAARLLRGGYDVQRQRRFAGGFRPVYLYYPAAGHTADSERQIETQRAGGNGFYVHLGLVAQSHNGAFAAFFLDLLESVLQRLLLIHYFFLLLIIPVIKSLYY